MVQRTGWKTEEWTQRGGKRWAPSYCHWLMVGGSDRFVSASLSRTDLAWELWFLLCHISIRHLEFSSWWITEKRVQIFMGWEWVSIKVMGLNTQEEFTSIEFKNDERNTYLFEMNTKTLIDGYIWCYNNDDVRVRVKLTGGMHDGDRHPERRGTSL